ncbi:MAG: TRAP transporter substrate-binding protein [Oscillospiraceae bacterium]|nr:TRAP transporter substrate-binding protein [Oscillospiraceae bacterium]
MKKIAALLLVIALVLAACGSPAPAPATPAAPADPAAPAPEGADGVENDPVVTLTYAEVNPLDSLMGQTAQEFKRAVEELSGGSIIINIQASGVLGAEGDVLDSMLGGVGMIDLARVSAFSLTPYGAARSSLLSVPFTFEDRDHFWRYAYSPLADELLMEPHDIGLGIRGLFYVEEGFRHFFTRSAIAGKDDLAGLQLRVSTDPIMVGMVESLGATATVVPFGELYSALQTGVVDGAEQPIVNYLANSFHEVAPYMILNAHTLGAAQVVMSDDAWNRLTERQQAVIMEAGRIASQFNRGLSEDFENEAIDALIADGVTFVPVTNVQEWRDAAAGVESIAEVIRANQADYDAILAMA